MCRKQHVLTICESYLAVLLGAVGRIAWGFNYLYHEGREGHTGENRAMTEKKILVIYRCLISLFYLAATSMPVGWMRLDAAGCDPLPSSSTGKGMAWFFKM